LLFNYRKEKLIRTTFELVDIIERAIPKSVRAKGGHPAKRVFQAIRIEVNRELEVIKNVIPDIVERLNENGRLCIITFHSLEDRIVKDSFKDLARGCICPKELYVCVCNNKPKIKIITKKPLVPSKEEMEKKKALRVLGLKEQYKTIDVIKYDEVMALVNKGVSYKEIAEGLGVSLTSFKNRCKELGIKSKRGRKRNRH